MRNFIKATKTSVVVIAAAALFGTVLAVPAGASIPAATTSTAHQVPIITAEMIPGGLAQPDTSPLTCEQLVCMQLTGSGLTVSEWFMGVNDVPPGVCTYGTFWAPPGVIYGIGQEECNNSNTDATYVAVAYNITFPGKMRACNTAQGFGGKPCNWVHP